jgi:diaminopimelate decarboxylase
MTEHWDDRYEELLRGLLPRLAEQGTVSPDAGLKALGMDSMAMVELLVLVEQTYDIAVPDEELVPQNFATPASLWALVSSLRARQAPIGG